MQYHFEVQDFELQHMDSGRGFNVINLALRLELASPNFFDFYLKLTCGRGFQMSLN